MALDYTGQFDDWRRDTEQMLEEETYKLDYKAYSFASRLNFKQNSSWLRSLDWNLSANYGKDRIFRQRWSNNGVANTIVPITLEPGEHDAILLPVSFMPTGVVDGQPLSLYSTLRATARFKTCGFEHNIQAGTEWKLDKNLGKGQVYDLARPVSLTFDSRPYPYDAVPAQQQLSWFFEEQLRSPVFAGNQVTLQAGVRSGTMLGLDPQYKLQGKWYADPRINVQWQLPGIDVAGSPLVFHITGGIGWLSKMPTISQLQPDLMYVDLQQFSYTNPVRPEYSRYSLRTYVEDLRNFNLDVARNFKKEIRLDAEWEKHLFSVTFFSEKTNSGFRTINTPKAYYYKLYDRITNPNVNSKPDLTTIPYQDRTVFRNVPQMSNGSQLTKDGVELTFITPRYEGISTRFTLTGAYFLNNYQNSIPFWFRGNSRYGPVQGDFVIFDNYAALYPDWRDGYKRKNTTASLTGDTYIRRLGLTMSLRSDFYFSGVNIIWDNNPGAPTYYLTLDGQLHDYTEADRTDPRLRYLIVPPVGVGTEIQNRFSMAEHLRASKDFGKWLRLSLFVQNLININPGFRNVVGEFVQSAKPSSYFGMELRLTL